MNVNDFVLQGTRPTGAVAPAQSASSKVFAEYKILIENNTDFVMSRKTRSTDKSLVFLVSKDTFYMKDEKSGVTIPLNRDNMREFLRDYPGPLVWEHLIWGKTAISQMLDIAIEIKDSQSVRKFLKHGMLVSGYNANNQVKYLDISPKLYKYCKEHDVPQHNYEFIFRTCQNVNYNNALMVIEMISEAAINFQINNMDVDTVFRAMNDYNLNFTRLMHYLLFDLYTQGIGTLNYQALSWYRDYLRMQNEFYGRIKVKYPKHLRTEHDIMTLKTGAIRGMRNDYNINEAIERHKYLEFEHDEYCILLPTCASDIVDEGIALSHCVGGYVRSIADGQTFIVFMRNIDQPNISLITIEITDNHVRQARGFGNRALKRDEREFLNRWKNEKGIN